MTDHSHSDADRWRELAPSDPGSDPSRDFWGDAADWQSQPATEPIDDHAAPGDDGAPGLTAAARRWWNSTGRSGTRTHTAATRSHFAPTGTRSAPRLPASDDRAPEVDASAPWLDADDPADDPADDGAWDDGWQQPVDHPRGGVDPLLARFGGVAVVLTLLVPVVMSFTSDSDRGEALRTADAPSALSTPAAEVTANSTTDAPMAPDTAAASVAVPPPVAGTAASEPVASETAAAPEPAVTEPTVTESAEPPATTATVAPQSESLTDARCGAEYEIVAGDFWIRLADGAGVDIADLFAVNDATSDTPLFPGRTICLPVGASTPPPPSTTPPTTPSTTAAPATTAAPSTTSSSGSRSTGAATTATTPRSTTAPTTTAATPSLPPSSNASADEVQAIIRAVWPDGLEERALEIARRESKYRATAKNNCCYGVFQIYWSVHRSWLAGLGVTSPEQLYDPTVNARAALTLYERAGGWGPWGG